MASTAKLPVLQRALVKLVARMLRPVARIALQHCMSCLEFEDIARWVFVDVALRDPAFVLPDRNKQFKSRAAILTGLSRKEVMRLSRQAPPGEHHDVACRSRAAKVVCGWLAPPFADSRGNPRVLPMRGGNGSFVRLVRNCGGDVPHRAMLDELLLNDLVEKLDGERIKLKYAGRLPLRSTADALDRAAAGLDGAFKRMQRQLHLEPGKDGGRRAT
jgi:hypothetical protein